MGRKDTFWGAYDMSLEEELRENREKMKELGIRNPTKIEASILVKEKSKRGKLTPNEVRKIIKMRRGL